MITHPYSKLQNENETLKFAQKTLSPGSLITTRRGNTEAYVFDSFRVSEDNTMVMGEARALPKEPFVIITTLINNNTAYCYVLGRKIIGWLPTWTSDGSVQNLSETL